MTETRKHYLIADFTKAAAQWTPLDAAGFDAAKNDILRFAQYTTPKADAIDTPVVAHLAQLAAPLLRVVQNLTELEADSHGRKLAASVDVQGYDLAVKFGHAGEKQPSVAINIGVENLGGDVRIRTRGINMSMGTAVILQKFGDYDVFGDMADLVRGVHQWTMGNYAASNYTIAAAVFKDHPKALRLRPVRSVPAFPPRKNG